MMNSNTGACPSSNQKITTCNKHVKPSLGAIFTLIATPDSEDIPNKGGDRHRKCIKDIKQTTAQFAKDFVDQQYTFLYAICKEEAKYTPCNLTLHYGNGSTTQVMVRYENEAEKSQSSVLEKSVRVYVKLAEKGMVSIIHADDELYEQLESTASNPSELYITTSKKADCCEALIARYTTEIPKQSVVLMTMKTNGDGFVSINPDPSAKTIEDFRQINRVCNDESSITPEESSMTSQIDKKQAPVARPEGGTSSHSALGIASVANICSTKLTHMMSTVTAQAKSVAEKRKYSNDPPLEKSARGNEQAEVSCATIDELENSSCGPTKTAPPTTTKRKECTSEGKKKPKKAKKAKDPDAPTRPLSSYFLFCADAREELKKKNANAKAPNGKELGILFGNISQAEKAKYDKKAAELQKQYAVEKAKYDQKKAEMGLTNTSKEDNRKVEEFLTNPTEEAGRKARDNKAIPSKEEVNTDGGRDLRMTKQSVIQKKKKKSKKDPNAPKRPKSNYLLYCSDHREKVKMANPGATQQTILKILSEGYRNMNEKEAQYYKNLFEDCKKEYFIDMTKYKNEKETATKGSSDDDDDDDDDDEEGQILIL